MQPFLFLIFLFLICFVLSVPKGTTTIRPATLLIGSRT